MNNKIVKIGIIIFVVILFGIAIFTAINKINKSNEEKEWNELIDGVTGASRSYITETYKNFITDESDMFISLNELIDKNFIIKEDLIDKKDNKSLLDKGEKYEYVKAYVSDNKILEIEYPIKNTEYIKITPRNVSIDVNLKIDLLNSTEISICDLNNECRSEDNEINNIDIFNDQKELINKNAYTFTKDGDLVLKYKYNNLISYRFIHAFLSDCKLVFNADSRTNIYLSLLGTQIDSYKLIIDGVEEEYQPYSNSIIKRFTSKEADPINKINVLCKYKESSGITELGRDSVTVNYNDSLCVAELEKMISYSYPKYMEIIDKGTDAAGKCHWYVKFTGSGTLKTNEELMIDAFLVGGGTGGCGGSSEKNKCGKAGRGGYNTTITNITLKPNEVYPVFIAPGTDGVLGELCAKKPQETTAFGYKSNKGRSYEEAFEFNGTTGDKFSVVGSACTGTINGAPNTGNGGSGMTASEKTKAGNGGSGILLIRDAR